MFIAVEETGERIRIGSWTVVMFSSMPKGSSGSRYLLSNNDRQTSLECSKCSVIQCIVGHYTHELTNQPAANQKSTWNCHELTSKIRMNPNTSLLET